MLSEIRRFVSRPSGRLALAVLAPVTVVFVVFAAYGGFLIIRAGDRLDSARLRSAAETIGRTWNPEQDPSALVDLAAEEGWERIWIVSATGRIVSSSEIDETGSSIQGPFWDGLAGGMGTTVRQVRRAGANWNQAAYHDVPRGVWAMIVVEDRAAGVVAWARLGGYAILAAVAWLLMVLAVCAVIRRRLERGLDPAQELARRILEGATLPAEVLERDRANAGADGPAGLIVDLAYRLQEQAARYREAESRFASILDLVPGAAFVASVDGRVVAAGAGLRAMVPEGSGPVIGSRVTSIPVRLPMARIHAIAVRARESGVTVHAVPVQEGDEPVWVSVAPVAFRGNDGYLVHAYAESDGFAHGEDPGLAAALVEVSADAVVAFDAEARTVLWNRAAEQLSGLRRAEVPDLRRVVSALFEGEESRFMEWLEAQPAPGPYEAEHPAADGTGPRVRWRAVELAGQGAVYGGALVGRVVEPATVRRKKAPQRKRSKGPSSVQGSITAAAGTSKGVG